MSEGIVEQTLELTEEARASGYKAPLRHAWASPPPGAKKWGEQDWDAYWTLYERAQGLEGCAYSEAIHDKPGEDGRPPHRHRVYLAITDRGTLVRTGWDYAKQEAVSRITEHDTGQALTKGKHNKHAARIARDLGREDVAAAMEAAGLMNGPPAFARLSPAQRAQQERTGITKGDVARAVASAWKRSDGVPAFIAALHERGLWLAQGTKKGGVPVILDPSGSTHGLRQMLGMAAREAGQPAPKQAAITTFLGDVVLPSLDEARAGQRVMAAIPANPEQPAPEPGHTAPSPGNNLTHPSQAAPLFVQPSGNGAAASVAAPASDNDAGPGMIIDADTIDGPGAPPGPGASVQEVQRWREKLFAYEERKEKAALRQQSALAAENNRKNQGVQNHAHVPAQAAQTATNAVIYFGGFQALAAEPDEGRYSAHEQLVAWRDTRDQGQGPGSGQPVRKLDGTASGGAAEPNPGNPVGPGRRRGKPETAGAAAGDAGAHARQVITRRAAEVRLEACVAALPEAMAALRSATQELEPAWREHREASIQIGDDRARIADILSTHPHPDPTDYDPEARERSEERAVWAEHAASRAAEAAATQMAVEAAFQNRSPVTWMRNVVLGQPTAAQRQLLDAADYAERNANTRPDDGTLKAARERGRLLAIGARDRTQAWKAKPEIIEALEQARLNQVVDAAAKAGDPEIARALRAGDPDAARQVILSREQAERQQQEAMERLMEMQRGVGRPPVAGDGGTPPGPRGPR